MKTQSTAVTDGPSKSLQFDQATLLYSNLHEYDKVKIERQSLFNSLLQPKNHHELTE